MNLRTWLVGALAVVVFAFPSASQAQTQTIAQLQAIIDQLLAQIAALQQVPETTDDTPFYWNIDSDPLTVEFTYTMNQKRSCDGGTYYLYFGDEDKPGGEEPQMLQFPADACNSYVQHTVHTYDEPGTYTATLYDKKGYKLLDREVVTVGSSALQDAIEEAQDDLDDAWDLLDEVEDDGGDVDDARETLNDAADLIEDAEDAMKDEDYGEVYDLIDEAQELIDRAVGMLEQGDDNNNSNFEDLTMKVTPIEGVAPLTVRSEVTVKMKKFSCGPVPFGTIDWDDGTTDRLVAERSLIGCGTTLTDTVSHTYTRNGTYDVHAESSDHEYSSIQDVTVERVRNEGLTSCSVTASKSRVNPKESVVLTWTSQYASSMSSWSGDKVDTSGSMTVRPTTTTTYSFTAFGSVSGNGKSNCSTTVHVETETPRPVKVLSFTSAQATSPSQSVMLQWNSQHAQSCDLRVVSPSSQARYIASLATQGSYNVYPNVSTTYNLYCSRLAPDGYTQESADGKDLTVKVVGGETPRPPTAATTPTVTFTGMPRIVQAGQAATLSWTSTNATSCTVNSSDGLSWNVGTSDSMSVYPYAETTYTLSCVNGTNGPTASKSVTLRVNERFDRGQLEASALSAIEGQLAEIKKQIEALFGR